MMRQNATLLRPLSRSPKAGYETIVIHSKLTADQEARYSVYTLFFFFHAVSANMYVSLSETPLQNGVF